jgi:hypothetical protein
VRVSLLLLSALVVIAGCRSANGEGQDESVAFGEKEPGSEEIGASDESHENSDLNDNISTIDPPITGSEEIKGGETYGDYDIRRDSYEGSRGKSHGDGCTVDCGGHNAGYEWASSQGITSAEQCGSNSWSFVEGCRAFADEQSGNE